MQAFANRGSDLSESHAENITITVLSVVSLQDVLEEGVLILNKEPYMFFSAAEQQSVFERIVKEGHIGNETILTIHKNEENKTVKKNEMNALVFLQAYNQDKLIVCKAVRQAS